MDGAGFSKFDFAISECHIQHVTPFCRGYTSTVLTIAQEVQCEYRQKINYISRYRSISLLWELQNLDESFEYTFI